LFLDVALFFKKLKLTFVLAIFCPGGKISQTFGYFKRLFNQEYLVGMETLHGK